MDCCASGNANVTCVKIEIVQIDIIGEITKVMISWVESRPCSLIKRMSLVIWKKRILERMMAINRTDDNSVKI